MSASCEKAIPPTFRVHCESEVAAGGGGGEEEGGSWGQLKLKSSPLRAL